MDMDIVPNINTLAQCKFKLGTSIQVSAVTTLMSKLSMIIFAKKEKKIQEMS
jgi:hypothetical protein